MITLEISKQHRLTWDFFFWGKVEISGFFSIWKYFLFSTWKWTISQYRFPLIPECLGKFLQKEKCQSSSREWGEVITWLYLVREGIFVLFCFVFVWLIGWIFGLTACRFQWGIFLWRSSINSPIRVNQSSNLWTVLVFWGEN